MKFQRSSRRPVRSVILASGFLLLGVACSDDTTSPVVNVPHVTASVDGVDFSSNYVVNVAIGDLDYNTHRIEIDGLDIAASYAGRQVTFHLDNFTGPGTYSLGVHDSGTWGFYVTSGDVRTHVQEVIYDTQRANAGTVTVTSFDSATNTIAGTFSLEVAPREEPTGTTVQITNGSFSGHLAIADLSGAAAGVQP